VSTFAGAQRSALNSFLFFPLMNHHRHVHSSSDTTTPRGTIIATKTAIRRVYSEIRQSSTRIVGLSRGRKIECTPTLRRGITNQVGRRVPVTIDILPDDVLLEIFDFDRLLALKSQNDPRCPVPWNWQRLAHVCQRWRSLVFASPGRLRLRLNCTGRKPVAPDSSCWPPSLPIAIWYPRLSRSPRLFPNGEDILFFVLEHRDRICEINLAVTYVLLEMSALRQAFPALEQLRLRSLDVANMTLVLPSIFLGASAPRLRDIQLVGVAFPTLPDFLLSTRDMVSLQLKEIPVTNLFSAEMLVIGLPALTKLKTLELQFASWISYSTLRSPHPSNAPDNGVLPSLTEFRFKGACDYLEYLVARLDTPSLQKFTIEFFDQPVFEIPNLSQFIGRTEGLRSPRKTSIELTVSDIAIVQRFQESPCRLQIRLHIPCQELGRRVDSLTHICQHLFPFLPNVERLDIKAFHFSSSAWRQRDQMLDSAQWLGLFRSFPSVKALGVSGALVRNIASALERATTEEMTKDVFPALLDLRFNGSREYMSKVAESFIAARQPLGRRGSAHSKEGFDCRSEDDRESVDA
jgi:hypothetical protein